MLFRSPLSVQQVEALRRNCEEFGIPLFGVGDIRQGIVHVIGPEQGLTQPGMTIVCGDSHTSTHGAFGALAFGIGTSEVEHVLATQTLPQAKPKTMSVEVNGELHPGVTAKDVILAIIAKIGVSGGVGHVIEYRGEVIRKLSMEGRMTICNMSIEGGARAGLIAPDDTTFAYMEGRRFAPKGADWEKALDYWRSLPTDEGAEFDTYVTLDASEVEPTVTWGTTPAQSVPVTGRVPDPSEAPTPQARELAERALTRAGYPFSVEEVLFVELKNRPGALARAVEKLARANIDIRYAYATAHTRAQKTAAVIAVGAGDLPRALKLLG